MHLIHVSKESVIILPQVTVANVTPDTQAPIVKVCFLKDIIELFSHCKGGNFKIHIWAWFCDFICSRREIRFCLVCKELISCLSCSNVRAFHENPDRYTY